MSPRPMAKIQPAAVASCQTKHAGPGGRWFDPVQIEKGVRSTPDRVVSKVRVSGKQMIDGCLAGGAFGQMAFNQAGFVFGQSPVEEGIAVRSKGRAVHHGLVLREKGMGVPEASFSF